MGRFLYMFVMICHIFSDVVSLHIEMNNVNGFNATECRLLIRMDFAKDALFKCYANSW